MRNEKLTDKDFTCGCGDKLCRLCLLLALRPDLEQTEEGRKILAEARQIFRKENQKNA